MRGLGTVAAIMLLIIVGRHFWAKHKADVARRDAPETAYLLPVGITGGPMVSFNFDDGFSSAFTEGMPIMEEAGFKTTHYIITNAIGERQYMTQSEILELQARGHEIGAHTLTHAKLAEIPIETARAEIFDSKKALFNMGIARIETFCYPNGSFNESVIDLVKEAGFLGARTTNPGLNSNATHQYKLLYLGMNAESSFESVKKAIDDTIVQKKWLIMVFHRVDESGFENVSGQFIKQVVDYVKEKNIRVVTNAQGIHIRENIPN